METGTARPLRWRLVLLVLAAGFPVVALLVTGHLRERRALRRAAEHEAVQTARVVADAQERVIDAARGLLVGLAQVPTVAERSEGCATLLHAILRENPFYANIGAADPGGDIYCSALAHDAPVDASGRSWMQRALRTRTFAAGDFQVGAITHKATVNVAFPVLRGGEVERVLFAALDLGLLTRPTAGIALPEGSRVNVLDRNGTILGSHPDGEGLVGKPAQDTPPLHEMLRAGEGVRIGRGLDGTERIFAFTPVLGAGTEPVSIVSVSIPRQVVFDDAERLLSRQLLAIAVALGLTMLVAMRLGDRLVARSVEEEQRALANRYRDLFEANPIPMWVYDRATLQILDVNAAAVAHYGYSRDEFLALRVTELRPPEDIPAFLDQLADSRTHPTYRGPWRHKKKDGTVIDVEITRSVIPYRGKDAALVLANDVTDRRRADEALRQGELASQRLGAIVEGTDDAVLSLRVDGTIESWNVGAERLYGYRSEEVLGRDFRLLVPEERRTENTTLLARVARGESVRLFDTVRRHKDGHCIDVQVTLSPIRDASGAVVGASSIARDTSERRQLEEQLFQAQKMEAVGRLAGGVAHDFNNVLSVVSGFGQLVRQQLTPGSQPHADMEEVLAAAARASALTRQLLAFARKQVIEPRIVDLNILVSDLDKMLRHLIGEDVELRTVLEATQPRILADPGQIEQVVMNLAVNARDAMERGGHLTLETRNVDLDEGYAKAHVGVEPGPYVLLAMTDTGTGMDAATREHIFEPFFTTKAQGKGTGLGLALVYGIVKQAGGHVTVYSEPGFGSTFRVYLPRAGDVRRGLTPRTLPDEEALRGTETVLVAEDDPAVRALVKKVLEKSGYHVLEARDSLDAARVAKEQQGRLDLVVTDVVMPHGTGPDLAASLRTAQPGLPVLFMSGYTGEATFHAGTLQPGDAFIAKPLDTLELLGKVRELLDARGR